MKNFFSKIKNGIGKVINNIKKVFTNLKDKIKNVFNGIRNKKKEDKISGNIEQKEIRETISNKSIEQQTLPQNKDISSNNNTSFKTVENDSFVAPLIVNKNNMPKDNSKNSINPESLNYLENSPEENTDKIIQDDIQYPEFDNYADNTDQENVERVVSINIKENLGVVEFETVSGKKYQKDIENILNNKKEIYTSCNINKKCNEFAKNKIQALRMKRRLNPVIVSTLNDEEEIDKYIKCVRDTENIWFELEHNLIDSKLNGKNARLMKRAGKYEEKIGAKVIRKENLIERMLRKIKGKNKEPEEMVDEMKDIENSNDELNKIEEEIEHEENKKTKKEKEKLEKREFKERFDSYAAVIKKLYGVKPRKKIKDIMNDVVDRDVYNLTDKDAWTRAVATFNVGHKLSMINSKEAEKYLMSAYDQLNNEDMIRNNENTFKYLKDTLLNLQELYIKENKFNEANNLNKEYMRIVEREKVEKYNPMINNCRKNGEKIKEIDLISEIRRSIVAGEKVEMKLLSKAGLKFEAEELYRKILNESGITLTDEAYDLSIKENCIENGKYIVVVNGITYREPILGNEKCLSLRKKLIEQLIKDKTTEQTQSKHEEETKSETKGDIESERNNDLQTIEPEIKNQTENKSEENEEKVETDVAEKVSPKAVEDNVEPVNIVQSELEEERSIKKKGIIARAKETLDDKIREKINKDKERKIREEQIKKQKEEQKRKAEEERKRVEEERRKAEEEKRKIEIRKKEEAAEFNKRYNDYNILTKGLLGEKAKKDIQEIKNDLVHNDIYNMTSNDETIKGVATFRVGHKLATLPAKKKEAERLLKSAISILKNEEVLNKDEALIEVLQNSQMDLGNLYLMNNEYPKAEKAFVDYMETVKKEKIERYDPKIIEAKNNGKLIDEINLWIEVKGKFTAGKKSMIKLLSRSGQKGQAEELYKKLLEDCKISLSDEEYQLSVDTNCIENGQYMRITKDKTYREPILGSEYLLLKKRNIANKALSER